MAYGDHHGGLLGCGNIRRTRDEWSAIRLSREGKKAYHCGGDNNRHPEAVMKRARASLVLVFLLAGLSIGWKSAPTAATRVDFGKIYLTDTHLFISELTRGIAIYDRSNLDAVTRVGDIAIEGNADMVMTGSILYADSYEDLLIFDLSDPSQPRLVDSVPDVFTVSRAAGTPITQHYEDEYGGLGGCSPSGCESDNSAVPMYDNGRGAGTGGGGEQTGQGGSMARFVINGSQLICIDNATLVVFDIRTPLKPSLVGRVNVGFGIETLFFHDSYLFIGSATGMFIYDARDVQVPVKLSQFTHARACDPVVVEGTTAYVTLRSSVFCGPAEDALHIVDIADVKNPALIATVPMEGPQGLAVSGGIGVVCDRNAVRVLDLRNPAAVRALADIPVTDAYDVISSGSALFIVGPMGLDIYDVSDPAAPQRKSRIPTVQGIAGA
jgi:hypothetical protein